MKQSSCYVMQWLHAIFNLHLSLAYIINLHLLLANLTVNSQTTFGQMRMPIHSMWLQFLKFLKLCLRLPPPFLTQITKKHPLICVFTPPERNHYNKTPKVDYVDYARITPIFFEAPNFWRDKQRSKLYGLHDLLTFIAMAIN